MNYPVLFCLCLNFARFSLNRLAQNDPDSIEAADPEGNDTLSNGSGCYPSGSLRNPDGMSMNLTISHKLFKTNELVPGVHYQVTIMKWDHQSNPSSAQYVLLATSQKGYFSKNPDENMDEAECGPHVFRSRIESHAITVNWSLYNDQEYTGPNVTFWLKYSSDGSPFLYSYSIPISRDCQLHLFPEEDTITNADIPIRTEECQVWFPTPENSRGIVVQITKLNVPCSKGFITFSGLNETHDSKQKDSYVYVKSHKQTHLCGKLEELREEERHIYVPSSQQRPAINLYGSPIFSMTYRLVDHCYNITFVAKNGSFELQPKSRLQCTLKVFLPYGNRAAMELWVGDTSIVGSHDTGLDSRNSLDDGDVCEGISIQFHDGPSSWTHCTRRGSRERRIDIVSRENRVMLEVTVSNPRFDAPASFGTFVMRMSYHAESIDSVVGACEFGWIELRQFCVSAMEEKKLSWSQAETECARKGGHLASLRSEGDQSVLNSLLMNSPGYRDDNAYWIGASDGNHEGDFKWSDGLPFSYSSWFAGWPEHGHYNRQPNDDGLSEQDCVEVRRSFALPQAAHRLASTFMWNDRDCSTANYFVCERPHGDEPLEISWIPNCNKSVSLSRDQPKTSVSSPGFPRQYPDNANCDIEIIATPGFRIILDFEELVLEDEPSCSYDYLIILESYSDSAWNESSTSTKRFCGDWSAKLKLLRYVSRRSRVKLRFSSDYSHHFGGFKARVSMENAVQCADDRFFMFNNSCYLIVSYPEVTWNTSRQICEGLKSNLSSVLTLEEEKFITSSIRKAPEYRMSAHYWLGAIIHRSFDFLWLDGHRMDYAGWIPGRAPTEDDLMNDVDGETCLSIQWTPSSLPQTPSGFYWRQHRCDAKGGYICKTLHQTSGNGIDFNRSINGTEGSLTTPNFPHRYHNNLDFSVEIRAPEKSRLVIKFSTIDIESQTQCLYDYVELRSIHRDGADRKNDAARWCGRHEKNMEKFTFVSETNAARVNFHSDYSIAGKGFSFLWHAVDLSACPEQTLTAQEGVVSSPNYPLARLHCLTTIMASSDRRVWLDFHTEDSGIVQSEQFDLELSLGGQFFKPFAIGNVLTDGTFISTGEILRVKLQTEDRPPNRGFRASYRIVTVAKREKIIYLGNSTRGALFHLNFPNDPPAHVDFTQHLIAPSGSTISLELDDMELGGGDCSSFIEIVDNYSGIDGTAWKLCRARYDSPTIRIVSFLNTLHLRQFHGANGVPLNCSLKVQLDDDFNDKLMLNKDRGVESCQPNPCQNGGKCLTRKAGKFCQCAGHYTGPFCSLTECDLRPCLFGNCRLTDSSFECRCDRGYAGLTCDRRVRPCGSNPCESRGKCVDRGDTFHCQCHAWWEGQRCERRMTHIPYTPLSKRMLHEPFWLGLMTVFVVMGVIGLVWCAKRHFPEKIEKLLAEEDTRNRRHVSSLRSSSVREQLAAANSAAAAAASPAGQGQSSRSLFGRLGIRKPSILSLTSPRAFEPTAARTFSLDDLLKPPSRRTPSPKKKRNNSTPVKKNVAEKRQILQQLVSPKPNFEKVSLRELMKLSEMTADANGSRAKLGKHHETTKFGENDAQNALIDPKLEKKVTFARLLNKVSAEMSSGSDVELGIMQTNRLGCMLARAASTPPSPNSASSNQDLLIDRRHGRLPNMRQKPSSADSILAMFRNFSSTSAAANLSSSLKVSPSTTPTGSSPHDDVAGDDDSSTSSIQTPVSFSGFLPESPLSQNQSTIEVPVLDQLNAHKSSSSVGGNLLHPPTILLEIPSTINKCLSPIREIPTPLPSPIPSPMMRRSNASTPATRRSTANSSLDDADVSDDRMSVEIPNVSVDSEEDEVRCADIAIDPQAEDGLILEEAAALQRPEMFRPKNRPPPIGQQNDTVTITIDPPPPVIPLLIVETPSPTRPSPYPGSPPPHRPQHPEESAFRFPAPTPTRRNLKEVGKPASLDLPHAPPTITITCNLSEAESGSPEPQPSGPAGMTYLSPLAMVARGSESNLSSSGYSSMASPCGSSNPLSEVGVGADRIEENIDGGRVRSAKELEVFIVAQHGTSKTSIVVQCDASECDSRCSSPAASKERFSPQLHEKKNDISTSVDSDGLNDCPFVSSATTASHKKHGRKREKKLSRDCKTPSPTRPPPPIFFSHLDVPSTEHTNRGAPLRKSSPKRRISRVQKVSSSSSSDSMASTRGGQHSSSSPSPDTMRWSSPVAWIGDKCSKSAEHSYHDIQNIDSSTIVKSADFGKSRYGEHQKVSKLRAISHQIRFLRRLEYSLKRKEPTNSPTGSFDSDEESPEVTSPLLSTKEAKAEIRKSSSIGRLQSSSKSMRGRYGKGDPLLPHDNSLKVIFTGNGYSD